MVSLLCANVMLHTPDCGIFYLVHVRNMTYHYVLQTALTLPWEIIL